MEFAILSSLPYAVFLLDISCVILISKSENCAAKRPIEEERIIILKDFIKQTVLNKVQLFRVFLFLLTAA